jgi:hypothetical protein
MIALSVEAAKTVRPYSSPDEEKPPLRPKKLHEVCRVRGANEGVDTYQQKGKTAGDQEPHRGFCPALAETIW